MRKAWTSEEIARVDSIIRERLVAEEDAAMFPGRSLNSLRHYASKRRAELRIAAYPARKDALATAPKFAEDGVAGSAALHRATVAMCLRRGITLPGLSPAHTRAIAVNLGIAA